MTKASVPPVIQPAQIDVKGELLERRKRLKEALDKFVEDANRRIAYVEGQIGLIDELIKEQEEKPNEANPEN